MGTPPGKGFSLTEYFKEGYILVCDDNSSLRQTIRSMARQFGVTNIMEVDDGDNALKVLKRNTDRPCLFVLLDWTMPRLSGLDVVREIRADNEIGDLPIMMVTAEADPAQIVRAAEEGINGYLTKPFISKVFEQKIQSILEARANPPAHVRLLIEADNLLKKGDYDNALLLFEKSLQTKETARGMVSVGDIHLMRERFDDALAMYNGAMRLNARFLKAYSKCAELHLKQGDVDAAVELLQKAIAMSPNSPDRLIALGNLYIKQADSESATDAFNKAVKLEPKTGKQIVDELLQSGNNGFAETFLKKIGAKIGLDTYYYNRMGIALRKQGKWKEAVAEYQEAIRLDAKDENVYYNMGKAYQEGKEYTAAIRCLNTALELRPGKKEFRDALEALEKLSMNSRY
ncbi:MAG: tetratricopeptide repeat protein [Nitrospinae bacterium]|nr:tetratricopeptide repeat protein [Nitrospinota bacterium]